MATTATISVINQHGNIKTISSFYDGYTDHTLTNLMKHYSTEEQALALLNAGDIDHFNEDGTPNRDYWEVRHPEQQNEGVRTYFDLQDWLEDENGHDDYNYIWVNGVWFWDRNMVALKRIAENALKTFK